MGRLRTQRRELFAQALADGKTRPQAMEIAGYPPDRGNQNRLAQSPDIMARVEELRRANDEIVDLRKLDRGRIMLELARVVFANEPLRAEIAANGPKALRVDRPLLKVEIRLEGVLAKHIEMRLLDDRGALSSLLRYDNALDRSAKLDFSSLVPSDFGALEQVLRALLRNRERSTTVAS